MIWSERIHLHAACAPALLSPTPPKKRKPAWTWEDYKKLTGRSKSKRKVKPSMPETGMAFASPTPEAASIPEVQQADSPDDALDRAARLLVEAETSLKGDMLDFELKQSRAYARIYGTVARTVHALSKGEREAFLASRSPFERACTVRSRTSINRS